MNYLVFLDEQAGELEKILSGTKKMVVREFDPARPAVQPVRPGDSLYLLRGNEDDTLRVKATVERVLCLTNNLEHDLSQTLKELQPKLQLTEGQYNHWSAKQQVVLVEFTAAHKIGVVRVAPRNITDRSDWIAFEEFSLIAE